MPMSPLFPGGSYEPIDYTPTSSDVVQNGMAWASGGIRRAQELRDPNSSFNQSVLGQIRQVARSAGPSVNELMQMQRGIGGMSRGSSITLAGEQARQQQTTARQSVGKSFLDHILNNEQMAVANQGQALGWNSQTYSTMNQREMQQDQIDDQYSVGGFVNQTLGLGGSILANWIGRK